ncbi:MAG: sigma 54-interacting transcriptional regulator, partial [Rhodothermales bacterium]|nr:sigma 54-interacting transcriptional regulator [Rhodothermales bacterium]
SRLIRTLPALLDEFVPILKGSETNDDPFAPISRFGRDLVAEAGDEAPIAWMHRTERYAEKLATPDTTMADLIGDIDPIKAATSRLSYADERVIHFGIIPRSNRGIFAINELPDLQPRIQVGLLNVMEEQDVQIRGFNIRFPLDVMLIFSANPEDYTNRGSIITPLKDRIDSQIITHYPRTMETGITITRQEAWEQRGPGAPEVRIPFFFREIVEQIAREARNSEYVDQRSGVSVRVTRAAMEDLVSSAERRALINGEDSTTSRVIDLADVEPAITGKVELVYEGEQEGAQNVARLLTGRAINAIFSEYFPDPTDKKTGRATYQAVLDWFAAGNTLAIQREWSFSQYAAALDSVPGLGSIVNEHSKPSDPSEKASMMEFVLEALHGHSLIGKDIAESSSTYSDMVGSMLSSFDVDDDDFESDDFAGLSGL